MTIRPYNSPGVSVVETLNASLVPLIVNPSLICILGEAAGEQSASERMILSGLTEKNFRYTGLDVDSIVVKDLAGRTVDPGAYVVQAEEDPSSSVEGDEPFSVRRAEMPGSAPAVSVGDGDLVGTYVYAVSYVNGQGETGIGPVSEPITAATTGVNLDQIPIGAASEEDEVVARNIYRAKVTNDVTGVFHLVATINNNVDTTLINETTDDSTAATNPEPVYGIDSGDTVVVSYDYTDQFYFEPTLFDDYDDIRDKYGDPFDSDGSILSPLSLGARFAFMNGASELAAIAVPNTDVDFSEALGKLEGNELVNLIVPVSGDPDVHGAVAAYLNTAAARGDYTFGIVGRDGSVSTVDSQELRDTATGFNFEAISLISPSRFKITNPITLSDMAVGAQYAAAAVAGMLVSRDVEVSVTRKSVAGFVAIDETRTPTQRAADSASGLLVIEPKGTVLRVRHAITTQPTNVNTREVSVVRAKYDLIYRTRNALDSLVGMTVPFASAPLIVQGATMGVLEQAVAEGLISTYQNVKARQLNTDPTTIEVRFEYTPVYPINNIIVNFTINTQTGEFTLTTQ